MKFEFVGGESFRRGVRVSRRRARFRPDRGAAVHKSAKHHHTRTPRLRFPTHNSKFRQEEKKTELYRLIQELCSVLIFENRFISCLKSRNRISSQPQLKKSVFVFLVAVEIIGGSADWIRTENGGIRTAGCVFRIAAAGNFSDLKP